MARETLLLIDGHALVYRAFFAMPALSNSRGEMTNAAYGFTSMLLKVLNEEKPTHAVAAFDPHGPTFRHEHAASYKAQRPEMPADLRPQIPWARDICRVLGIPLVESTGFEADDVIGTLAQQAEAAGMDVIILTGDLDALQLVSEHVVVYAPRRGITDTIIYNMAQVRERFGFDPPKMVDYKALRGDPSDNIPGIPEVGEKTASSLIQEYGSLDAILAATAEMKPGRLRTTLEENAQQARESRYLATIRCDVDVTLDRTAARLDGYDEAVLRELFEHLEFRSLLPRLPQFGNGPAAVEAAPQTTALHVEVVSDTTSAAAMITQLRGSDAVAIRTLAGDDNEVVGVALADLTGNSVYYIPLGQSLESADAGAQKTLRDLLGDASLSKHGYDLKRELVLWRLRGVEFRGIGFDAMLAAYVVNTRTRVAPLSVLAHDLCDREIADEATLLGSGRNRRLLAALTAAELAQHAGAEAAAVGCVETKLEQQLQGAGAEQLYADIEHPLIEILAEMETAGIRIDPALLARISGELTQRISEIEASIYQLAERELNLGSTQQLAVLLYDDLGLAVGRKTKMGRSTDADSLEALRDAHPAVGQILEWRQLTKLKSTYVDVLPQLCDSQQRIHTSFQQAVAATGRLSSANPNLQNIPVRTEWGQRIRAAFIADPGTQLISADYSQIELRVLAHFSGEPDLVEGFRHGEDIHRRTAAEVYGVDPEVVTPDMRRIAKVVNFGVLYGLSDFGLARDTGMPREQAAVFIQKYFASFPRITAYLETVRNQARQDGYVETLLARRRYLPDIRAANRQIRSAAERMAVNMPMQGTAADIMKIAMIRADRALKQAGLRARLLLQVHDELLVEAPDPEVDTVVDILRQAMSGAVELHVPLDVDVKVGHNWAEMTKIAAPPR